MLCSAVEPSLTKVSFIVLDCCPLAFRDNLDGTRSLTLVSTASVPILAMLGCVLPLNILSRDWNRLLFGFESLPDISLSLSESPPLTLFCLSI